MSYERDLSVRVAALERQNRRLRRFVAGAALCAVTLPVLTAFGPAHRALGVDEIKAERFVLVDTAGKERGALEFANGTPQLVLRDPAGTDRIAIGVEPTAAFLLMRDEEKKNRLGLAVDMFPHLMLQDAGQQPRIHASVGMSGAPSLLFSDPKGAFALGMGIDAEGKVWRKPEIDKQLEAEAAAEKKGAGKKDPVVPPADESAGEKKKSG